MNEINICPRTIRKQDINEILYNTYSVNGWNPDYQQIPIQRRLKFLNGVMREVIKNPELAKEDPTYAKIFDSCVKSIRKQCKGFPPEKIEPFCKSYTKNVLKLDEKYIPQVMASLFDMGELSDSFSSKIQSAHNSLRAMEITYNDSVKASQAAFIQNTIRPDADISSAIKTGASINAYRQAG